MLFSKRLTIIHRGLLCCTLLIVSGVMATNAIAGDKAVFDRDIQPIFSENCFACHGPDAAQVKADGVGLSLAP